MFSSDASEVKADLELAAWSALSMLDITSTKVECGYYPYAELKATARLCDGVMRVRVSDGFAFAEQSVLNGLLVYLSSKLFRKQLDAQGKSLVREYKAFVSRETAAQLNQTLRRLRHRAPRMQPKGDVYHLHEIRDRVLLLQQDVLEGVVAPEITWSAGSGSRRTLAYHDPALDRIVVSKKLDSRRIPQFVLEYIVYHELLHAKHDVKYSCGESLRRTVHTRAFYEDEKKFPYATEAEEWMHSARW